MFITENEIRKTIRKLLIEGQRTDAFSEPMAQTIVTAAAVYCMRIFMRSTQGRLKTPPNKFELNFDFSKTSSENLDMNKAYNIDFLMSPKTTQDKLRREAYLNHPELNSLIKRMLTLHKKHNAVYDRLVAAMTKLAKRTIEASSIVPTRMDEEISKRFSGKVKAIINMDPIRGGLNNLNFVNSARHFSGNAHIDPTTGDMQVSLHLPNDFMNFFSNTSNSQIRAIYAAFEKAKSHLKGAISHELTHVTQMKDFDRKRKESFNKKTNNAIVNLVDTNVANYTPINEQKNPLISRLYNRLGDTLKSTFSGGSNVFDIMALQARNHGNQKVQTEFTFFDYIIRHFSPDEIDAYVRGHRTDALAAIDQNRHNTTPRRENAFDQFSNLVQSRVNSLFPPNSMFLPVPIRQHIVDLGINYQDMRDEGVLAYEDRYIEIFGDPFNPLPDLEKMPKQNQITPRTKAQKLIDAIDSEASLEFRTDPIFANSIQYMKDTLRSDTIDDMAFDQIKTMIRNAGYEIRTGSGKMGNRIFKKNNV